MGIFERFMDQQAALKEIDNSDNVEKQVWQVEEERQSNICREIIKSDFLKLQPQPYDHFNL